MATDHHPETKSCLGPNPRRRFEPRRCQTRDWGQGSTDVDHRTGLVRSMARFPKSGGLRFLRRPCASESDDPQQQPQPEESIIVRLSTRRCRLWYHARHGSRGVRGGVCASAVASTLSCADPNYHGNNTSTRMATTNCRSTSGGPDGPSMLAAPHYQGQQSSLSSAGLGRQRWYGTHWHPNRPGIGSGARDGRVFRPECRLLSSPRCRRGGTLRHASVTGTLGASLTGARSV
mmetsp:Transcript_14120/g.30765  ORF Transcript_14120/g.30765 Transcript_14120/m.30765 type:complete len:232 (+) Transcript_14120:263-958(+)